MISYIEIIEIVIICLSLAYMFMDLFYIYRSRRDTTIDFILITVFLLISIFLFILIFGV